MLGAGCWVFGCLFVCGLVCLFVCVFGCLLVCLFVSLFVCLSGCLFVCVFVCLLGADAGAGALFGSFCGPGVLIWSPFWLIWDPFLADLGSLLDIPRGRSRDDQKTLENANVSSGLPVWPKRLPPSVLACRGDLLVFPYPKSSKNTQITTAGEQRRRKLV